MRSSGIRAWMSIVGVFVIGLCLFGLSIQGAPAGDEDRGSGPRGAEVRAVSEGAATTTQSAALRVNLLAPVVASRTTPKNPTTGAFITEPPASSRFGDEEGMRVFRSTSTGPSKATPRDGGTAIVGDFCNCDGDCASSASACEVVICSVDTGGGQELDVGEQYTCQLQNRANGARCDLDGLFCTADECNGAGLCVVDPDADADGPCLNRCDGSSANFNETCEKDSDCQGGTCLNIATCDEANDICVAPGGNVGRCCAYDVNGDVDLAISNYKSAATCFADGGTTWLRVQDEALTFRCPKYSAGIASTFDGGGNLVPPAIGTEVGPVRRTDKVCEHDLTPCEDAALDCLRVCVQSNGQLPSQQPKACTDNIECATLGDGTATCQTQTCAPLTCGQDASHTQCTSGEQMRCPGDFRVGDDYVVSNGSFIALKQFRYRGGVDHSNQTLIFDFWDSSGPARCSADGTACSFIGESCASGAGLCWGPMRINAFGVAHDSNVTSDVISIEVDCGPFNCFGDTDAPENPAFRIPGTGYVTMRSTRNFGGRANGFWRTSGAPDVGTNDNTRGWRNGGPLTDDSLVAGTNNDILAFELVGDKIPEPLGACCGITRLVCSDGGLSADCEGKLTGDPCAATGTCNLSNEACDDIHRYDCSVCVSGGPRLDQVCSATRECSPLGADESRCSDIAWKGARFNTTTPKACASLVCDIGGCCDNGVCTEKLAADCTGGSTFLGLGSSCNAAVTRQQGGSTTPFTDPEHNCCPQTPTAGDCCEDTPYCSGDPSDSTSCTAGNVGTNCGGLFCEFYGFDFVCSEAGGDADCGQGAIAGSPCGTAGTCGVPCGGAVGDNCSSTPYCAGVIGNPPCELVCSVAGDCTGAAVGSACGTGGTCQTAGIGTPCFGSGTCTQSTCAQPTCQFCTGPIVHTIDVLNAPITVCSISGAVCDIANANGGVCDCPGNIDSCNYVCAADSGANTGNPCSLATEATDCTGGTCGVQVAGANEFCVAGLPLLPLTISGTRPFKDDPQSTGLARVFDFDDGDDCSLSETDAGYYEVFEINDFSRVTIDLCCNDPNRTAYFALFEACTCTGFDFILSNIGQAGTGDTGLFGAANNKADLQCSLNSGLSMTFNLPPGRYAYPLQANRSCSVTTANDCDDITDCPSGEQCSGQVERDYQMHLTVTQAQRAACCTGVSCQVVTKLECEGNDQLPTASPYFPGGPNSIVLEGNWLGAQGPEDAIVDTPVADCSMNVCTLGACCGGASGVDSCDDTPNGGNPGDGIDEATCAARTGGQGFFEGGVRCVDDPCPACPLEDVGATFCQKSFDSISSPSDRHHEFRVADDFIPLASAISRVCWSGVWLGTAGGVNCNDDPPDDVWYMTIYNDDGNGLPDMNSIVFGPETPFTHDGRKITDLQDAFKPTTYSAPVTITGLVPNDCYWIEIQGEGSGNLIGDESCSWEWMRTDTSGSNQGEQAESEDGNGWSVSVAANHPVPYSESNLLRNDYAWCADSGIRKNTAGNEGIDGGCGQRQGTFACCYRDEFGAAVCTSTVSLFKCILGEADAGLSGTVFTGVVCPDNGGNFACAPPANDDCVTGAQEILQSTCAAVTDMGNCAKNKGSWCSPTGGGPGSCGSGDGNCIPIKDANQTVSTDQFDCDIVFTDNRFATTDGPPDMDNANVPDDCSGSSNGGGPFRADVWYKVTPPCTGVMSISMCGGGVFDAMMAAYTQCPDGNDNSAPDLINCNDDACGSSSTVSEVTPFPVTMGNEVVIRIGGWSPNSAGTPGSDGEAGQGNSQLHVRFACTPSGFEPPGTLAGEAGFSKDRYVSIDPTTNGTENAAIRVTRAGSATDKYVDCTSLQDKGADGWYAALIDGPLPAPGDASYYCDWSGVTSGLHIRGCSVVPGNDYNVAITIDGAGFSTDLVIPTTPPQWPPRAFGDLVGGLVAGTWTAPDGLVSTNDIAAVIKKFGLDPDAPLLSRVDTSGAVPNAVISSGDILREVRAFAGDLFGSGVTDCKLGQCIPPVATCEINDAPVPGKCCFSIGEPGVDCVDDVTAANCNMRPTPHNFVAGASCTNDILADCGECALDTQCTDGIGCTVDTCVSGNCVFTPNDANCLDSQFCNGTESCSATLGCQSPGDPCAVGTFCNEATDFCDECAIDTDCDDTIGCTDDTCVAGSCVFTPNDANCPDDLQFCNGTEFCSATLDCQSTGDPCALGESCNEVTDTCDVGPGPPNGACCLPGGCLVRSSTECDGLGGTFSGDGTGCLGLGACCIGSTCQLADGACCVSELGGIPQGFATFCAAATACCTPDGSCVELSPVCCENVLGGVAQAAGTVCLTDGDLDGFDDACPSIEQGCCLTDGSCVEETATLCLAVDLGTPSCGCTFSDSNGNTSDDACDGCGALTLAPPLAHDTGLGLCTLDSQCPGATVCRSGVCYLPTNRYISFDPNTPIGCVAFQVELTASTDFPGCVGLLKWVGEPDPITGVARLVDAAVYRQWTESVVHVGDHEIVPEASYAVRAILESCQPPNPGDFTAPVDLPTAFAYGDIVGLPDDFIPDGIVDFIDLLTMINVMFGQASPPGLETVDLGGSVPDRFVDLQDLVAVQSGFAMVAYQGISPCAATPRSLPTTPDAVFLCQAKQKDRTLKKNINDTRDTFEFRVVPDERGVLIELLIQGSGTGVTDLSGHQTNVTFYDATGTGAPEIIDVFDAASILQATVDIEQEACLITFVPFVVNEDQPCKNSSQCPDPPNFCVVNPRYLLHGSPDEDVPTAVINTDSLVAIGYLNEGGVTPGIQGVSVGTQDSDRKYVVTYEVDISAFAVPGTVIEVQIHEQPLDGAASSPSSEGSLLNRSLVVGGGTIPFSPPPPPGVTPPACRFVVNPDCNGNGIPDACDIDCNAKGCDCNVPGSGQSQNCDSDRPDLVPDECQIDQADTFAGGVDYKCVPDVPPGTICEHDCNQDGKMDRCEIDENSTAPDPPYFCVANCDPDCNINGIPDACEIDQDDSFGGNVYRCDSTVVPTCEGDCNQNGTMDRCEIKEDSTAPDPPYFCDPATTCDPDCNINGIPDACDIGTVSQDCQLPGEPGNGIPDECDIMLGDSQDCQLPGEPGNGIPDECDIRVGVSQDCQLPGEPGNGIPDECDIRDGLSQDCQLAGEPGDGIPDECDIRDGVSQDCQLAGEPGDGIPDECDIAAGTSCNENSDTIPDECQLVSDCGGLCDCNVCDGFPSLGIDEFTTTAAFSVIFTGNSTPTRFDGFSDALTNTFVGRSEPILDDVVGGVAETDIPVDGGGTASYPDTAATVSDPCVFPVFGFERDGGVNHEVQAEILTMSLTDASNNTFKVGQAFHDAFGNTALSKNSVGEFHGQCIDFPAKGFFDLYFELDLAVSGMKLHNLTPLVVVGENVVSFPDGGPPVPWEFSRDFNLPPVVLVDEQGIQRAYLVGAEFGIGTSLPDCDTKVAVDAPVSFAVDNSARGLSPAFSSVNHVRDDFANNVDQLPVTVYVSAASTTDPPDTSNSRSAFLRGTSAGFTSVDNISGLSFGQDGTNHPGGLPAKPTLYFSVNTAARGIACSAVFDEGLLGDKGLLGQDEAGADIYSATMSSGFGAFTDMGTLAPPCDAVLGNCLVLDETSLGLAPGPTEPHNDELTALELGLFQDNPGDLAYLTILSSAGATDQATIYTFDGTQPFERGALVEFAVATVMGLQTADEIDALAVSDAGAPGTLDAGADSVLFSLAPGSASLSLGPCAAQACSPADIFISFFNGSFAIHTAHSDIGLLSTDNVDAIDVGSSFKLATDCNSNGISDACDGGCGTIVNPPNVLTGELGFTKDRYISFAPNTNGTTEIAFRVTRVVEPPGIPATPWYVSRTLESQPFPDEFEGSLTQLVQPAEFRSWENISAIHVRGCEIVPGNTYLVEATIDGVNFSEPLSVFTTSVSIPRSFGDLVGSFDENAGMWGPPDGFVNTKDIRAIIERIELNPSGPHISRVDNMGKVPQGILNASDLDRQVGAFEIDQFGFDVTGCETGTCVPSCP